MSKEHYLFEQQGKRREKKKRKQTESVIFAWGKKGAPILWPQALRKEPKICQLCFESEFD